MSVADQAYTGKKLSPAVTVRLDGEVVPASCYDISYSANREVGLAGVTVTGKPYDDGISYKFLGYMGKATGTFRIKGATSSLAQASIAGAADATYTGKAIEQPALSVSLDGEVLAKGADYDVAYADNTNAGTAKVTVTGKGSYEGSAEASFEIAKAANSVMVSKSKVVKTFKAKKLKKKAHAVALPRATASFGKAAWSVSAKDKRKALSLKGGKVRVKKGAKKGTYTIKLKASVPETRNYRAASSGIVTVSVKVK